MNLDFRNAEMKQAVMPKASILVASKNPVKIMAATEAFEASFDMIPTVYSESFDSGVPEQPWEEQTYKGAENRAVNAYKSDIDADFYIGLEGGLFRNDHGIYCKTSVYLLSSNKEHSWASTTAFHLPTPIAKLVEEGMELGPATDLVFGTHNSKQDGGFVGVLTNKKLVRKEYYKNAIIAAFIPFINYPLYYDNEHIQSVYNRAKQEKDKG